MKLQRTVFVLFPLSLILLLGGCEKEPAVIVKTDDGKIVAVKEAGAVIDKDTGAVLVKEDTDLIWPAAEETVRSQVKALNNEDLGGYMSYIHSENPGYGATKGQLAEIFEKYDLRNTVEKIERQSVTADEVKASFVQLTEKLSGPAFKNNRTSGVHTLRKDGGKWKIYATETNSVVAVDPAP